MTSDQRETTQCTLCTGDKKLEKGRLPAHVLSAHGDEPTAVRREYPKLYESLTKVVREEFGSFEELMQIANSNESYIAALREDYYDDMPVQTGGTDSRSSEASGGGSQSPNTGGERSPGTDNSDPQSDGTEGERTRPDLTPHDTEEALSPDERPPDDDPRPNGAGTADGQPASTSTQEEPIADDELDGPDSTTVNDAFGLQNKWFFLGVGGCGGNIVDSVLLRVNSVEGDRKVVSQLWNQGLHDAAVLNTNGGELGSTYYAREYADGKPSEVAMDYLIGEGGGAGTDPMTAVKKLEGDIDEHGDDLFRGYWRKLEDIDASEGVMLLHSAVKGTGTGASPVLTEQLKKRKIDSPVFHFVILPDPSNVENDLDQQINGLYGVTAAAQTADAVIVLDNANLRESGVDVDLSDYEEWKDGYRAENKTALAFLEGFAVSSIVPAADEDPIATGDMFDIEDAFGPVTKLYDDGPAPILAPALGERSGSLDSKQKVRKFIQSTLQTGKLTDFEPDTAWGASFLFYGPSGEISDVKEIAQGDIVSILDDLPFEFDFTGAHPGPVHDYYVSVEDMETTRLWIIMWNPEMGRLRETKELSEQWADHLGPLGDALQDRGDQIDELFEFLGVDYFEK